MYLEVEACSNCNETVSKIYKVISGSRKIQSFHYEKDGIHLEVAIIGWDAVSESPCPVYSCQIEESGDGVATLIYGGSGGIRMKPLEDKSDWDINNSNQWSESHLVLPLYNVMNYLD